MVSNTESFTTASAAGTVALGRRIAERLRAGDCVALIGPLGAGKTALVRGIAMGLGLGDRRMVSSPTYVLVQEYPARVPIYHVDLYRMASPLAELADLGIDEMLADGVVLIEWADRAGGALPTPRWEIEVEITSRRGRRFALRLIGHAPPDRLVGRRRR
jgi:tRNA threonylcarbamoyladenosine biosynthesis protein TsaE